MAKVDLELVKLVAQRQPDLSAEQIARLIEDLSFEARAADDAEEKTPAVKKQFVIVVSDPHGEIAALGKDFTGWVVQTPEDDNPALALGRIHKGAFDFNRTPKGQRLPLRTVAEACEFCSAKIFKEHKMWVKTKEPVLVALSDNKIPIFEEGE